MLILLLPSQVSAGPISKFDGKIPKIDIVSQIPISDIERCLIDLDGHPAPQVYRQPDRPDQVRLLWQVRWDTVDRADLSSTTGGTSVKIWVGSNQMRSCAAAGVAR
jgi:hypothetical protein